MFEKEKKKRDVAPTRGQLPCPAFGPHGCQSLGVGLFGIFSRIFFFSPPFFFFLLSFFSGFLNPNALSLQHCQSGHLRTCAQFPTTTTTTPNNSARTHTHTHTHTEICRQQVLEKKKKEKKKVWGDISLWS